jgi:hypothetical protein
MTGLLTELQELPANINAGLRSVRSATLFDLLGHPRQSYTQQCQSVTHDILRARIVTRDVGPFRVSGFDAAVDALGEVMEAIRHDQFDVYSELGTAGMLCARNIRGSTTSISRHSWGVAVDLTIGGKLDRYGDGKIQSGLARIIPIFNRLGWYSGAAFGREDSMHFEGSDGLLRTWLGVEPAKDDILSLGDRGPEVGELQRQLNRVGLRVLVDDVFDARTREAVVAYQALRKLATDGRVGPVTMGEIKSELADTEPAPPLEE